MPAATPVSVKLTEAKRSPFELEADLFDEAEALIVLVVDATLREASSI